MGQLRGVRQTELCFSTVDPVINCTGWRLQGGDLSDKSTHSAEGMWTKREKGGRGDSAPNMLYRWQGCKNAWTDWRGGEFMKWVSWALPGRRVPHLFQHRLRYSLMDLDAEIGFGIRLGFKSSLFVIHYDVNVDHIGDSRACMVVVGCWGMGEGYVCVSRGCLWW